MSRQWPSLQVARDNHQGNHPHNWPSAAYGYHVEAVTLWFTQLVSYEPV